MCRGLEKPGAKLWNLRSRACNACGVMSPPSTTPEEGKVRTIAAYTAIAALLTLNAAMAAEVERPVPHKPEAKESEKHPTEQQNRMKSCNAEAAKKELKGDERKAFMSSCLRNH
jgi:hypothetical protein